MSENEMDPDVPAASGSVDELDGWVTDGPDGSKVLRLQEPVCWGKNASVTELRIPRMRAEFMRALKSHDLDGFLDVAELMTKESRRTINNLGVEDTERLVEVIARGFPSGRPTGAA